MEHKDLNASLFERSSFCVSCGHHNEAQTSACAACGKEIDPITKWDSNRQAKYCMACRHFNEPNSAFCILCGTKLEPKWCYRILGKKNNK